MKTTIACVLTAACVLSIAAAWPSPLAINTSGSGKYVFFGQHNQHVTIACEKDAAWVGARSVDGIYGWAIIAEGDGKARLQVRDENGGTAQIDLLKAARVLRELGAGCD